MKIFLIVHVYPPEHAPAGIMLKELSEDLAQNGHQITIFTGWPNHPQGAIYEGWRRRFREVTDISGNIKLIRCAHYIGPNKNNFNRMLYYFTFAISTFICGLFEKKCDLILCLSTPIFGSWSSYLLARFKMAKFIYDIFDLHPESAGNAQMLSRTSIIYRLLYTLDTALTGKSDLIITLSEEIKHDICKRGISKDKIKVIPFWLDTKRIHPVDKQNRWRVENGIAPEKFVALFAGTFGHVSGAGILSEVASKLAEYSDILILCVGEGPVKDKLMEDVRSNHADNIKFLPFQTEENLRNMLSVADAGLVTLLPDACQSSIPSKILGYFAAGKPVIASVPEHSAIACMLNDGGCGMVVPSQNAEKLAEAVLYLYKNHEAGVEMGDNALKHVISKYSRSGRTLEYEMIFKELLK